MCLNWEWNSNIRWVDEFLCLLFLLCLLHCHFVSKVFQYRGSCTHLSTVWLQWLSAATGFSVPLCCSSSCSSLSSSPLHPVSGRWIRFWVSPCSCSTLSSWCLVWCWKIASLSALFPSELVNRSNLNSKAAKHSLHLWPEAELSTHTCNVMSVVRVICRNCADSYCRCSALLPVTLVQFVSSNTRNTTFF